MSPSWMDSNSIHPVCVAGKSGKWFGGREREEVDLLVCATREEVGDIRRERESALGMEQDREDLLRMGVDGTSAVIRVRVPQPDAATP